MSRSVMERWKEAYEWWMQTEEAEIDQGTKHFTDGCHVQDTAARFLCAMERPHAHLLHEVLQSGNFFSQPFNTGNHVSADFNVSFSWRPLQCYLLRVSYLPELLQIIT